MTSDPPHSLLPAAAGELKLPVSAVAALVGAATLMAASIFLDARVAAVVTQLPSWAVAAAAVLSRLGRSTMVVGLAGAGGAGVILACTRTRDPARRRLLAALRDRALYLLGVLAVSCVLTQVIKHLVGRARPHLAPALGPDHFDLLSLKASLASFPSGYATTVFAAAAGLSLLAPRGRAALFAAAGLVAASRIVVVAHYASDVLAGGLLGIGSALLVARLCAGWSIAFERDATALRIKDAGILARSLRGDA